ncbi:MAG: hypothetical protein DRH44_01725 [Candidatus Coatesbacteria bacterium]|nr:MAG: hypothetical protein DRH44_01725 [Candidatus Coatesbacteria bacterium]
MDEVCEVIRRVNIIWLVLVTMFGVIWFRTFQLQVIESDIYKKMADDLHSVNESLPAKRGTIYDRENRILATERQVFSCYALTNTILNKRSFARKVSDVLMMDYSTVLKRVTDYHRFVWIKRNLTPEEVKRLRAEKIEGLRLYADIGRNYPYSETCCHVLGFVDVEGKSAGGVESYFSKYLRGFPGLRVSHRDGIGRVLWALSSGGVSPQNGYDLYLTIDVRLQRVCENIIATLAEKNKARGAVAIVLDLKENEILSLVSYPMYDPNEYNKYSQREWMNRAVSMVFEPGSVMKPVIMALAINDMRVNPMVAVDCSKPIITPWGEINDFMEHKDILTLPEILVWSSNIGISKLSASLDGERIYEYLENLNFGRRVGIGLPGEASGILNRDWINNRYGKMYVSFGQGIGVTAIQVVSAYACIANGGVWKTPRLIRYIKDGEKVVYEPVIEERRVLSETTCNYIKAAMDRVVSEGFAKEAFISGYRVAGKTGTAEKMSRDGEGEKYFSQMVAFFPSDDPAYLVFVLFDEPEYPFFGSRVAAPAIKEIITNIILLYNLPPMYKYLYSYPEVLVSKRGDIPNFVDLKLADAYRIALENGLYPVFTNRGDRVKKQFQGVDDKLSGIIELILGGDGMPYMVGLPSGYALSYLVREGYEYKILGDGDTVVEQKVDEGGVIILRLGDIALLKERELDESNESA